MTEFQNRRQHWIFPFSVGGDKCAACCIFVAPIYFRKADEQCAEVSCCPCCPKTQHTHSTKQKKILLYCQFRLCITTALFRAAAKAEAGKARTPLLKKIGENYYEKTNEN